LEEAAYGALFFLVALAFSTRLDVQFTLPKLAIIRAVTPVLLCFWTLRLARQELRPLPRFVLASALGLSLWWIITSAFAVHPPTALNGAHGRYNGLWTQEILLLQFLIIASSSFGPVVVERLTMWLVGALAPVSLYTIIQYFGWDPISWRGARVAATIGNPVILAATIGLGLPFAIVFVAITKRRIERFVWGAIALLLSSALIMTRSRGPFAAGLLSTFFIIATAGWEIRDRLSKWLIAAATLAAVLTATLGYRYVMTRADLKTVKLMEIDESVRERFNTLAAAVQIVRDHPLTGVGLENFSVVYPRYRSAASERLTPDVLPTMVHSGYLQLAATTGNPGLLLYLVFLSSVVIVISRAYRENTDPRVRWLALAFLASIFGYCVQDFSGWPELSLSAFFWIILGLGVALAAPPQATRYGIRIRRAAYAAAALSAVAVTWLARQSIRTIHADGLIARAQESSVMNDWSRIEIDLSEALEHVDGDGVYFDKAGLRYAERFAAFGERAAYQRSAALFDAARRLDPFNPYFLIHWVSLETTALQKKTTDRVSPAVSDVIPLLLEMDRNNASGYAAVARLRLAEGRAEEARRLIDHGESLRPDVAGYRVLEGDIRRALNDRTGAIDAYRRAVALFVDPAASEESLAAWHKLIVTLAQGGMYQSSADEAQRLIAKAPADALAYTLLGIAYQGTNNLDEARQAYRSALRLNSGDIAAKRGLQELEEVSKPK